MSTSTLPLFGQAWELVVTYATATGQQQVTITSNAWEPEALRMTFEVLQTTVSNPWWFADIVIYNLNDQTIQNTLYNATWCTLRAGFQTGPNKYAVIWDGPVFQVLFDRENVVDRRVTLHCVANPTQLADIVAFSVGPFASQQQLVARMAAATGLPPIDPSQGTQDAAVNQRMTAKQFPRGRGVFGKVSKYLVQMAEDQFSQTFQDGRQAYMGDINNGDLTPAVIYAPVAAPGPSVAPLPSGVTASIVGTPRQTPFGIIFEVLLDPRMKVQLPALVVQLDRSTVYQQLTLAPNPNSGFPSPFTSNLTFFVSQVRHHGDTRGNDWQTEVTGYTTTYAQGLPYGIFSALAGGGAP